MSRFAWVRWPLVLKILISYLVIVVVGVIVLASAAEAVAPASFARHIARMQALQGSSPALTADLFANYQAAVNESLFFATSAAVLAAVAVSLFVSRRIVGPIREMMLASQRIATGRYHERVEVTSEDELGELARSFNQMAAILEQTELRRLELIGNVAHELRTPLASIRGTMEGLIDGVLPAEPATFQLVYREAARLQRLVQDLQDLSRVEAGQVKLSRRPTSVASLIQVAIDRLQPQFEDKGVTIAAHIPAGLPPVLADEDRIGQVLLNLIGNALQYTPAGGRVRVSVDWQPGDGSQATQLVVSIDDTGIGITAEHLSQIFERFYRVDKSRSRAGGGSGIGLTIARRLVELHGGRIWAESAGPGQGSTFYFTLPVAPGA
jgi:signal transduction histidine kinase